MKSPRIRILSASLALGVAPFMGGAFTAPVHAADIVAQVSAPESVFGLSARLPKDTESVASLYRLRGLLDGFLHSNLVKKVLANEKLASEMKLDDIQNALTNDPQVKEYANLAADVLGGELTIAFPAGFSDKFAAIFKALPAVQAGFLLARGAALPPGGNAEHPGPPKELLPIIESIVTLEVPPVLLALKAGQHKDTLKALLGQAISQIPGDVMSKLEEGKFEASGASFESITIRVSKVMDDDDKASMERDLGPALAKKLQAKSVEIAWGWLDDYLVVSIGQDHSHVKFVSAADSVLTHPDVAAHAAQLAAKKPFGFTYTSQKTLRAFGELGGIFDMFAGYAELGKKAGAPVNLDNLITELKALDAKADALWPNDADAAVGGLWWDGGLHAEAWGGRKPRGMDSSKPLTLPSLAGDKTFLMVAGRADGGFSDKVWQLVEDTGISLYTIWQKDVRGMLPEEARQGAAMGEAIGLPMLKEVWKSVQNFRAAMGTESGLLLNLDGAMPSIPGANIPQDIVDKGRIPRLAVISEMKDRAKLTASWNGLQNLITTAAGLIASQTHSNFKTEPVLKKEGGVEMFGFELPMDLGDVWPHLAVSGTHWFLGSSPSFTKELAGKAPSAVSPALGMKATVNFPALWNFAADWSKNIPTEPEIGEMIEFALSAARCLGSLDAQAGEDAGQAHSSLHWTMKDAE